MYFNELRYNFESKSQLQRTQNLGNLMYFNELRYNFESKSQQSDLALANVSDVFQWTKIQFWKQITTAKGADLKDIQMYFNELRYNFESKSQPQR